MNPNPYGQLNRPNPYGQINRPKNKWMTIIPPTYPSPSIRGMTVVAPYRAWSVPPSSPIPME